MKKKAKPAKPARTGDEIPGMMPDMGMGRCLSCGHPLYRKGGYGDTGLCGPCCTGEATTLEEMGVTW